LVADVPLLPSEKTSYDKQVRFTARESELGQIISSTLSCKLATTMPFVSEEDPSSVPEHNPLVDARDDVLAWIDKITRDVEVC
jgi:hypothetical protein